MRLGIWTYVVCATMWLICFLAASCGRDERETEDRRNVGSCSVIQTEEGAEITCPDGTAAFVADGAAGRDGQSVQGQRGPAGRDGDSIQGPKGDPGEPVVGPAGRDGRDGRDGDDGTSCTVEQVDKCAVISCTDGSTAQVCPPAKGGGGPKK